MNKKSPLKPLFMVLGVVTTALAILGIFVPGLPVTPLLLLSSWLFYRSSERLHDALHRSFLGDRIRAYEKNRGMTIREKVIAISLMTVMVTISATIFISSLVLKIVVFSAGFIGFVVVGFVVPTIKK